MTATPSDKTTKANEADLELGRLLDAALQEPGVAEAVEFYERVAGVYHNALSSSRPVEQTTNSANA